MTRRKPSGDERRDIEYGERVARTLAGMDLGQTAVVKDRAAVALEAMEGTDEAILRAGRIAGPGTTVVKVSKPRQDMRFDVPVVGPGTLAAMREAGARVLALDAGRTLLIDRPAFLEQAEAASVAVWGLSPPARGGGSERWLRGPVRAGVIGVGALGRHHARVWADTAGATLVGVHDVDAARAAEVAAAPRLSCLPGRPVAARGRRRRLDRGPDRRPPRRGPPGARAAGGTSCVEKPITATLEQADELVALAAARQAVLQTGHIERFNPATAVLLEAGKGARFVEVHRLGSFSARSLDVDVVLDLMIHDLDIVLTLDGTEPVQIEAVGIPVLTQRVDIANARLRFASGLIANLTASRVSLDKTRKFRVFAPRTYVSADFTAREAKVYRLEADEAGRPRIVAEKHGAPDQEPLRRQIEAFRRGGRPPVGPRRVGLGRAGVPWRSPTPSSTGWPRR